MTESNRTKRRSSGEREDSKRRPIGKADYEALASFRYALRRFLAFSKRAAESVGLRPQQHQALLAIEGYPGRPEITVGELAERLQIRHHSAVGLVDRLVSLDLVRRRQGEEDRRVVYVGLTSKGRSLLERLSVAHREELKTVAPAVSALLRQLGHTG